MINLWYGNEQRVGHLGEAQADFNLLGDVEDPSFLTSLTCSINGFFPEWHLQVGGKPDGFGDGRRLARTGHFNADIPLDVLRPGENVITLTATYNEGDPFILTAYVQRETGEYALPTVIDWSRTANVQDVGQCVDGNWGIQEYGLRTLHSGYDRVFLIGERTWRDYEVNVRVTVHRVDEETGPHSGGNGLGILNRFQGHVTGGPRHFPPGQPKWGYQPFGSITWLRWMNGSGQAPDVQFYRGEGDGMTGHGTFDAEINATYHLKVRSTTLPDTPTGEGATLYQFKIWEQDTDEPGSWHFEETQVSPTALREGGVVLLAHHVDATFGNVVVYDHTENE
jgi:hypothetical protein